MNYFGSVGRGLAPAERVVELSERGKIARKQLLALQEKYSFIKIDKYVVMPNHIHAIIVIENDSAAGASPRPTLMEMVCSFKSLTTRECNALDNKTGRKIFQTSFYDTVITTQKGYEESWLYIDGNVNKTK